MWKTLFTYFSLSKRKPVRSIDVGEKTKNVFDERRQIVVYWKAADYKI